MNTGKPIGFILGSPHLRLSKHVWLLALLLLTQTTSAQLGIAWDNRFGTTNYEEIKGIVETADGNYLLGAHSGATPGFDFTGPTQGSNDYWVIKIDPAGNIIWDANFGGDAPENVAGMKALSDGNYIIYGWSSSGISGDKMTDPSGNAWWTNDFWVVKFDPTGTLIWEQAYGGTALDQLWDVEETADGGLIMGGMSTSGISGNKSEGGIGSWDMWVIKTDPLGNIQFDRTLGGSSPDMCFSVAQAADGGYYAAGLSSSPPSGTKSSPHLGSNDYYLVKLDATGAVQWDRTFGGATDDQLRDLKIASDGNLLLGGWSDSAPGGTKTAAHYGNRDFYLVKTTPNGAQIWDNSYGGSDRETGWYLTENSKGSYIMSGHSNSSPSGNKTSGTNGGNDYWWIYVDEDGNKVHEDALGGALSDHSALIHPTTDNGLLVAGASISNASGDKTVDNYDPSVSPFTTDIWALKLECNYIIPTVNDTTLCQGQSMTVDMTTPFTCSYLWDDGSTSPTRTIGPTNTTSYSVTLTDIHGCEAIEDFNVIITPNPTVDLGNDINACPPFSIELNAGNPGHTFLWSTNENTQTITTTSPGTYSVTVTNSIGCSTIDNITINSLPIPVPSLGPDLLICEGESATLDAGNPGANYIWSTAETTQTISVNSSDQYTVQVTNSDNCSVQDTIEVTVVPNPILDLGNDTSFCLGQSIILDAQNTGASYSWSTAESTQTIEVSSTGTYSTTVTDGNNCQAFDTINIEINLPTTTLIDTSICPGNGFFAQGQMQYTSGTYYDSLLTSQGCDSVIITNLSLIPLDTVYTTSYSCDPNDVGVFENTSIGTDGCDSLTIETVQLHASDIIFLNDYDCDVANIGLDSIILTNQNGCDSLIVTETFLLPADTSYQVAYDCDVVNIGLDSVLLTNQNGCDSLIVTETFLLAADTSYQVAYDCDVSNIGLDSVILTNQNGCDSLIVTETFLLAADTSYQVAYDCDVVNIGLDSVILTNQNGCDSIIVTETFLLAADTSYQVAYDCDVVNIGLDSVLLTNQNGCDSLIVTETFLLPADTSYQVAYDCDVANIGLDSVILTNQNGCDSLIVTETFLLAADTSYQVAYDCDVANIGLDSVLLTNQNGCDSLIVTETFLLPADTSYQVAYDCDVVNIGLDSVILTNQNGCDSLIITETFLLAADTSYQVAYDCDVVNIGLDSVILTNQNGCDSLIVTETFLQLSDTTYITEYSCLPLEVGIDTFLESGTFCDSTIIIETILNPTDSTTIELTSCNPNELGTVITIFSNQFGCDSTVTVVTSFQEIDATELVEYTCDPTQAGIDSLLLVGQECDSLVITTTILNPSHFIQIDSFTCDSTAVGTDTTQYINQFGCDSTVVLNIELMSCTDVQEYSCDPLDVGIDTLYFTDNQGLDSIVYITTNLLNSDTTYLVSSTCDPNQIGVFSDLLQNSNGCDSLVIDSIYLLPQSTTMITESICDLSQHGVIDTVIHVADNGCDSLVITETVYAALDTQYVFQNTCLASTPAFDTITTTNALGCDSTAIISYQFSYADTIQIQNWTCDSTMTSITESVINGLCDTLQITTTSYYDCTPTIINANSCDADSIGTYTDTLVNIVGLDSVIITNVSYLPADSLYTFSSSCNPLDTGMTITTFINMGGCESYEFNYTSLLTSNFESIVEYSCDENEWKDSTFIYTNQVGCDSTVHLQVLPAFPEVEYLDYETCDPAQVRTDTVAALQTQYGCDSIVVERISLTNLNFDIDFEDILCEGDKGSIFISPIEGKSPFSYGLNDSSLMQEIPVFTDLEAGNYQILIEDDRGCIGQQEITFYPSSQISVDLGSDIEIDLGETVQLEAIVNQSPQSLSWLNPNQLSCTDCLTPMTQPSATTTHFITVTDENGCESTARVTIFVKKDKGVYVPNAFSPNGDGENDIFTIYTNNSVEKVELLIVDRFGEIVFQENDLIPGDLSIGWNGTLNGRKLNPGVFVYMAKIKFIDGREEIFKGDITLVR